MSSTDPDRESHHPEGREFLGPLGFDKLRDSFEAALGGRAERLLAQFLGAVFEEARNLGIDEAAKLNARRLILDLPLHGWLSKIGGGEPEGFLERLARRIVLVAHRSDFLTDSIASDEGSQSVLFDAVRQSPERLKRAVGFRHLHEELAAASRDEDERLASEEEFHTRVSALKRRELTRIGLLDLLNGAEITRSMRELSSLSEAIVQEVHSYFYKVLVGQHGEPMVGEAPEEETARGTPAVMCIVTMGKGGGRELNYSSDIDLVFVYSEEGTTAGRPDWIDPNQPTRQLSNHDFFNRVAERLVQFLTRPGPGGAIYRVDTRLRPEGGYGPLTRSLGSYRHYFADQALTWERVAYAKARAISGPKWFRREVERCFAEFVYAEIFNTEILPEIQGLKTRIDAQVVRRSADGIDIKRGKGGIREIEFLLVALQLLYANDIPELRARRSTLGVIDALAQGGVLDADMAERIRAEYLFLRALEQRLQLFSNRQTHFLPMGRSPERDAFVRRIWEEPPDDLDRRIEGVRVFVETEFHTLFREERAPVPEAMPLLADVLNPEAGDEQVMAGLARYRIRDSSSLAVLRRLSSGTREIYTSRRGKRFFEAIFASLMNVAARVPYPDAALRHFEDFVRRTRSSAAYFELLAEHPRTLEVILRTTGHGDYLATLLARHPEYVDQLFSPETLGAKPPQTDHLAYLRRQFRLFKTPERRMRAVRRHRHLQTLQLGVRDVLGLDSWPTISHALSRLARETLVASLEACSEDAGLLDRALAGGFAILGLGKLSIDELTYFSDLDIVFVAREGDGDATTLAHDLIEFLGKVTEEGFAYEIDARLRPLGRTAPLVISDAGLREYFEQGGAETWEFLAFTRATFLAGDREIGTKVLDEIGRAYRRLAPALRETGADGIAGQTRAMRARLEESVGRLPPWAELNFKRGRGGLVDLEFARQVMALAALANGEIQLGIDGPAALASTDRVGGGDPDLVARWGRNYQFMRRIEASNRLLRGDTKDYFPSDAGRVEALAFAVGRGSDEEAFVRDVYACLEENREIFDRTLDSLFEAPRRNGR